MSKPTAKQRRHPRFGMVTITVKPGQTYRGVLYFKPEKFDTSPEFAAHLVQQGTIYDFCQTCGAGIPPREGEGRNPCCTPWLRPA